jgi:DNA-binding LacI/PurR family transcriptional regulator
MRQTPGAEAKPLTGRSALDRIDRAYSEAAATYGVRSPVTIVQQGEEMRLHVDQRHERVLELVRRRGSLRVAELAAELGVSAVTLRRDVEALAAQGRVRRIHGAVVWPGGQTAEAVQPEPGPAGGAVVGMVVPTTDYIFGDIVRGARETVEAHGGRLVLGLSGYVSDEDPVQAERLLSGGADGLLAAPSWARGRAESGQGEWLLSGGAPTVLVERWAPPGSPVAELDRVRSDRVHGAAVAVRHLASLGHRRIAPILQPSPHQATIREGYAAAVEVLGLDAVSPLGAEPATGEAERFGMIMEYLASAVADRGVTAALVHSDADAIVLVPRLRARGIRVPEDLALVAYDDEVASLSDVPLTAVAPPKRTVGEMAAKLLLARLAERGGSADPRPRQHIDLLPELRVRASCGGGAVGA